jgi:NADPH:quinone reductase-like Zn-dependent oxidoreductase
MENQAAYILSPKARLQIKPSPLPQPGPNEVLIRNDALSINPIDIVQQDMGITVPSYPHVRQSLALYPPTCSTI